MYYIYILTTQNNTVLYTGVTNDLKRRLYEHKNEMLEGFTKKYHVHKLVYFEMTTDVRSAITREKQIKNMSRAKKETLITEKNPHWDDLAQEWL